MKTHNYFLFDETNLQDNATSMARTTGYTASAVVEILDRNIFSNKGVFPPELVGSSPGVIDYLINHLRTRKIYLKE